MTETHLESSLREIREQLLSMAGNVERAIEHATQALLETNPVQARNHLASVYEIEKKVNHSHIEVDDACIKLLALQHPLAADLRLIVAILKINTDLERMGDQAVNISHNAERYMNGKPLKPLVDLPRMSEEVRVMVRQSLDAFVRRSAKLAHEVLFLDDSVDELKNKVFRDVLTVLKTGGDEVEQGLNLILIARNLERIGDHATNIAEDVIFAVTGEDIRHGGKAETHG